jgi:DNA-binding NarL/FixJ family response regulator
MPVPFDRGPKILGTFFWTIAELISAFGDRSETCGQSNQRKAVMNVHDIHKTRMMPAPVRIAVFDDHAAFRESVIETLKRVEGFEIVGDGMTADDAIKVARENAPDVVLLDICMPGGGIEAVASIADGCPNVRTIVLTFSEREDHVTSALRAGARGYVLKGSSDSEIVSAVHAVVHGDFYFTPNFAVRLLIERSRRIPAVVNERPPQVPFSREVSPCNRIMGDLCVRH